MDGNPYSSMVALMQGQGTELGEAGGSVQAGLGAAAARMRLGRVVSAAPLAVSVAGMTMPSGALRVNERLDLKPGDEVLLLTQDDQIFYIIMKVARAI